MKIYIHTDLEGVTGVASINCISEECEEYSIACRKLAEDINAAVRGAFDGGADFITVLDSHGGGGNISMDMLDSRVDFDIRENKRWWGKLDSTYDAAFFIGAHAMAGTMNAFLDHTQSSMKWFNYYVNGRKTGELGQWAMVAGHFDVPLIMVSGDEAAVAEAYQFCGNIECAAVKRAVRRNEAILYDEETSREKIYKAAYCAVRNLSEGKRYALYEPTYPAEIKLEVYRTDYAEEYMKNRPWVERMDGRTLRTVIHSGIGWHLGDYDEK